MFNLPCKEKMMAKVKVENNGKRLVAFLNDYNHLFRPFLDKLSKKIVVERGVASRKQTKLILQELSLS